jgi:acetyl-CoA C-acetyltransferase
MTEEVYIASYVRTPMGNFGGSLSSLSATDLGAIVIKEAVKRAKIDSKDVEEVFFGNVCSANLGQAPARQAALKAGLSMETPCTQINKVCASGMKSVMLAAQTIQLGKKDVIIAGGMESMSKVPFYSESNRFGQRLGNSQMEDGLLKDGLTNPFNSTHMGLAAEKCSEDYKISREEQDNYVRLIH